MIYPIGESSLIMGHTMYIGYFYFCRFPWENISFDLSNGKMISDKSNGRIIFDRESYNVHNLFLFNPISMGKY
jgi:hypothetical protein